MHRAFLLSLGLLIALVAAACADDACTPGAQVSCDCPGGDEGVQVCAADGNSYEACSCNTGSGPTSSSGTTTSGGGGAGGGTSSSTTGSGGNGGVECELNGEPCAPWCIAPAIAPSNGVCVTLGADTECNPVTNAGCATMAGAACDISGNGFSCKPPPNIMNVCGVCGGPDSGSCRGGQTCIGKCARYCCDEGDCNGGICFKDPFAAFANVGVCVSP
jgi:hypothetical protein